MLRTIESSFWMRISGDTVDITCVLCVCVYYVRDKEVFLVEKNSLDCTHKKAQKFLSRGRKRYFTRRTRDDDETYVVSDDSRDDSARTVSVSHV
jgi:hypothetical protein